MLECNSLLFDLIIFWNFYQCTKSVLSYADFHWLCIGLTPNLPPVPIASCWLWLVWPKPVSSSWQIKKPRSRASAHLSCGILSALLCDTSVYRCCCWSVYQKVVLLLDRDMDMDPSRILLPVYWSGRHKVCFKNVVNVNQELLVLFYEAFLWVPSSLGGSLHFTSLGRSLLSFFFCYLR